MSHLARIVELKEQLTDRGVTCPVKQRELLKEPFTRAITRYFYMKDCNKSEAFEAVVWKQLEKWNNISPIPAQNIMATFKLRCNMLRNAMLKTGALPDPKEFCTRVDLESGSLDVSELSAFEALVNFLVTELESCNE